MGIGFKYSYTGVAWNVFPSTAKFLRMMHMSTSYMLAVHVSSATRWYFPWRSCAISPLPPSKCHVGSKTHIIITYTYSRYKKSRTKYYTRVRLSMIHLILYILKLVCPWNALCTCIHSSSVLLKKRNNIVLK